MFTLIGIGLIVVVAFLANREQNKNSERFPHFACSP